ncbi:MAG: hypothetical protein N4A41_02500 [Crocinitomicaceae bacterium]|jgi:hypothetical protein|nr:hypothetical protein [Crocinitomicaceae bacterium]
MPGEGAMSAMNSSMKNNRAQSRSKNRTNHTDGTLPHVELNYVEPSAEELELLKAEIRAKAKVKNRIFYLSMAIGLILTLLIFLLFIP